MWDYFDFHTIGMPYSDTWILVLPIHILWLNYCSLLSIIRWCTNLDGDCDAPNLIENQSVHYIKKCLLHQVLIQQNMYIVVLEKISHL